MVKYNNTSAVKRAKLLLILEKKKGQERVRIAQNIFRIEELTSIWSRL